MLINYLSAYLYYRTLLVINTAVKSFDTDYKKRVKDQSSKTMRNVKFLECVHILNKS